MSRIAAVSAVLFLILAACNSTTAQRPQAPSSSSSETGAIGEASPRRVRREQQRAAEDEKARAKSAKNEPTTPKQPFPRDDAKVALRAAEGGLRSCRLGHDAWEVEVTVKFDPSSGNVTSSEVTPMRGSRETELFKTFESCLKTRLTEVSVTPFAGQAVTMTVPMRL